MIIRLKKNVASEEIRDIKTWLDGFKFNYRFTNLYQHPAFTLFTQPDPSLRNTLAELSGIEEIYDFDKEYMLASRVFKPMDTQFPVCGEVVGGRAINVIAGPCSIESEEQIFTIAESLHNLGVKFIRGGAYKPRTSPYRFQGLGKEGLKLIRQAADKYNMRVVTEIIDSSLIEEIYPYADILQIGSRNMQNFYFLKQLGKIDKPVLLKRGMYARIDEWLMAAEYILSEGNEQVILCERGIRTFDTSVRNTMDIAAIPLIKSMSHLPVFADPSHGTGKRNLVTPATLASIAAGADGMIVEIHPDPTKALSDGPQSLYLNQFESLVRQAIPVAHAVGRMLDVEAASKEKTVKEDLCVE